MLLLATNSTYHALRVTPITMGRLAAILPFHQPITRTHKRNRSPPLSGSQKTAPPVGLGLASASGQDLAVPPRNAFQEDVPPLRRNETERDGGGGAAGGGGGGGGGGTRPARWWSWRKWKAKKPGRWTCSPSTRLALKNHLIACMGEFVGTVLFLFLALGTASVANLMATSVTGTAASNGKGAAPNTSSLFYIATGAGLSLTVTTFTFSRISGALFSPAVSLGMALVGALTPSRAILLTCVQFLGGICAGALVNVLTPGSQNYTTRLGPAMSVVRGLFLEVILTACLILTIFFLVAEKHKGTMLAPIGIGLAFWVAELYGVFWTGGSLNPARSLGPAVVLHSFPKYFWIYMVGPCLGAILAAAFYKLLKILEYETVIPATPDPAHRNGGGSSPGSRAAAAAHQAVTVQGPGLADLLTRDPPGRPPSAGGHQHRPSTSASVRNSQLQERFDRLEEIIEQLGRQGPGDSPARAMVDSDENSRGTWCNQLGPHAFEEKLDGDGSEEGTRAEVSSQLIDMLTPLQSVDEVNKVGQEAETRKGQ